MLQQVIDGVDIGAGQVITMDLDLDSYKAGLTNVKWLQLFHGHNFRAGSPTSALTVLVLLWCPSKVQGLLS